MTPNERPSLTHDGLEDAILEDFLDGLDTLEEQESSPFAMNLTQPEDTAQKQGSNYCGLTSSIPIRRKHSAIQTYLDRTKQQTMPRLVPTEQFGIGNSNNVLKVGQKDLESSLEDTEQLSSQATDSGEQHLSMAVTSLTREKKLVEKKLASVMAELNSKKAELFNIFASNKDLKAELEKYKNSVVSLKSQVQEFRKLMGTIGSECIGLREAAVGLEGKLKACADESVGIRLEIKERKVVLESLEKTISTLRDPIALLRDIELERNKAFETIELLQKQLSDYVGELTQARDRVTTLEDLLTKEKELQGGMAAAIKELKKDNLKFLELQERVYAAGRRREQEQEKRIDVLSTLVVQGAKAIMKKTRALHRLLDSMRKDTGRVEERLVDIIDCGHSLVGIVDRSREDMSMKVEEQVHKAMDGLKQCMEVIAKFEANTATQPETLQQLKREVESTHNEIISLFYDVFSMHSEAVQWTERYEVHLNATNMVLLEEVRHLRVKAQELSQLQSEKIRELEELSLENLKLKDEVDELRKRESELKDGFLALEAELELKDRTKVNRGIYDELDRRYLELKQEFDHVKNRELALKDEFELRDSTRVNREIYDALNRDHADLSKAHEEASQKFLREKGRLIEKTTELERFKEEMVNLRQSHVEVKFRVESFENEKREYIEKAEAEKKAAIIELETNAKQVWQGLEKKSQNDARRIKTLELENKKMLDELELCRSEKEKLEHSYAMEAERQKQMAADMLAKYEQAEQAAKTAIESLEQTQREFSGNKAVIALKNEKIESLEKEVDIWRLQTSNKDHELNNLRVELDNLKTQLKNSFDAGMEMSNREKELEKLKVQFADTRSTVYPFPEKVHAIRSKIQERVMTLTAAVDQEPSNLISFPSALEQTDIFVERLGEETLAQVQPFTNLEGMLELELAKTDMKKPSNREEEIGPVLKSANNPFPTHSRQKDRGKSKVLRRRTLLGSDEEEQEEGGNMPVASNSRFKIPSKLTSRTVPGAGVSGVLQTPQTQINSTLITPTSNPGSSGPSQMKSVYSDTLSVPTQSSGGFVSQQTPVKKRARKHKQDSQSPAGLRNWAEGDACRNGEGSGSKQKQPQRGRKVPTSTKR